MERCSTCKYWKRSNQTNPFGYCDFIDIGENRLTSEASIEVMVHDDSGLQARLMTGAAFGCTLYFNKVTTDSNEIK